MEKLCVYPLGFSNYSIGEELTVGDPSPIAERIWKLYHQRTSLQGKSFEIQTTAVEYMLKQIGECGSLSNLLHRLMTEEEITPTARRYIDDTITFIMNGERDIPYISVPFALKLSSENEDRAKVSVPEYTNPELSLANWLRQPNGLVDMIWFIKIVFGDVLAEE